MGVILFTTIPMARLVVKTAKEPMKIQIGDKSVKICMCGLSKNQPYCDDSHMATKDEKDDLIYEYDEKGKRIEMNEMEKGGCCGGGCCGEQDK